MAQRHESVCHHQLISHPKSSYQLGLLHVQRLTEVCYVCPAYAQTVNLKVHVHMVERLQDITHAPTLVIIIDAIKHNILNLHWLW